MWHAKYDFENSLANVCLIKKKAQRGSNKCLHVFFRCFDSIVSRIIAACHMQHYKTKMLFEDAHVNTYTCTHFVILIFGICFRFDLYTSEMAHLCLEEVRFVLLTNEWIFQRFFFAERQGCECISDTHWYYVRIRTEAKTRCTEPDASFFL